MSLRSWVLTIIGTFSVCSAHAGLRDGGGGDLCEDRFQIVRNDIADWIKAGGSAGLTLPHSVSQAQYSQSMLTEIKDAKVSCVKSGDPDFPIVVGTTAKICVFSNSPGNERIICDFDKFQSLSQSDQYVLVHHEYAGLSGLEVPNDDVSTYDLSNQLTGYLSTVEMKRLSVTKPIAQQNNDLKTNLSKFVGTYRIVDCSTSDQNGFQNPVKKVDCSHFRIARFSFFKWSQASNWAQDFDVELINPKSVIRGGSIIAYGNNQIGDTCTTFPGNQFCTGESQYGHWVTYLSMKPENGYLRVIYGGGIIDRDKYHYGVTTLLLRRSSSHL